MRWNRVELHDEQDVCVESVSAIENGELRMENYSMFTRKHLWSLLWTCCSLIAAIVLLRAWSLRLLYFDEAIREQAKVTLETVSEREGWLLSDVSLRKLTRAGLTIHYRQHVRGPDPTSCYTIAFDSLHLLPCPL